MAFFALGVARPLQPWRIAGVRHWLFESEDDRRLALSPVARPVAAPVASPAGAAGVATGGAPVPPPPGPAGAAATAMSPAAPNRRAPERPMPVQGRAVQVVEQAAVAAGRAPRAEAAPSVGGPLPSSSLPAPLPVPQWPESWRALLAKSPPRPLVVWTYPAMSDDYGGRSDPVRRAFLQRILHDLAMPVGSNAFWPQSGPPYDQPAADADPVFFHSGLAALSPAVVVFFGEVPPRLGLPPLAPLSPDMFQGRRVVRVQPVDQLAANMGPAGDAGGEGARRHLRLVQFLKSLFPALKS